MLKPFGLLLSPAKLLVVLLVIVGCAGSPEEIPPDPAKIPFGDTAIIQYLVRPDETPEQNADRVAVMITEAAGHGAKLVVTPETPFYRYSPYEADGVSMPQLAASFPALVSKFSALAAQLGVSLVVGFREPATATKVYNTAIFFGPDGSILGKHRKVLPSEEEDGFTLPGTRATTFNTPFGRVGLAICKDIHSPVILDAYKPGSADLFIHLVYQTYGESIVKFAASICSTAKSKGIFAQQVVPGCLIDSAWVDSLGEVFRVGTGEKIAYAYLFSTQ